MENSKRQERPVAYSGDTAGTFASNHVSRSTLTWIFIAQGFVILPLFLFLPLWLAVIWFLSVIVRVQVFRGVWPFPGNILKVCIGFAGVVGLYWSYGGRVSVEPMIAFLLLSFVLKLIEVRNRKDVLIVLYIGFVATAAQLLLSQNFWMSLYSVLSCGILLAALQSVFQHRKISITQQLFNGSSLLLQSLPVMLILFLIMPRLGQLWAVPSLSSVAKTGFSDTMSPGDFSRLIQSNEIVFRATFSNDNIPTPRQRYWRGLVLDEFDGVRWKRFGSSWSSVSSGAVESSNPHPKWRLSGVGEKGNKRPLDQARESQVLFEYGVLLEPHYYPWLFSLMAPLEAHSATATTVFNEQGLLVSGSPVTERSYYDVVSLQNYFYGPSERSSRELIRYTELPTTSNPRARQLAESWLIEGLSPREIVAKAQDLFRSSFTYTLQPPLLGFNPVDDFLFHTQRGFCEHFSSSFVFLMRAAGIPARVVVGYQGGEYKEDGRYIVVRQSDAHAWSEVWLEESGWTRVDPTAAVSPLRIERALHEVVDSGEASLVGGALFRVEALAWLTLAKNRMEELEYLWQTRVLSYNDDVQNGVFKRLLGGSDPWRLAVFFVGGVGGLLLLYFLINQFSFPRKSPSVELSLLLRVFRQLERQGYPRGVGETPRAYARRVGHALPQLKIPLEQVVRIYYEITYKNRTDLAPQYRSLCKNMHRR